MKKYIALLAAVILLISALPALADTASVSEWAKAQADMLPPEARVVNIFTWAQYVPEEVCSEFESETGIRVNFSPFLDNEDVAAKLQTSPGQYDIIVCSEYMIYDLIGLDLLSEIDPSRIPNYVNIDPTYQSQYFDPDNLYTVPYSNTIPLIVYNPEKIDFEVEGFADLWNEGFTDNLSIISEWRNVIGIAQKKLGYSFNESDPAIMDEVLAELKTLKKNIAVMNDDTPHSALIYGDAIAGYMFGSQILAARDLVPQLKVVYPKEGINFGIDNFVMPRALPHPDAAYIFLNYMLDGEVSAYASDLIDYGNCNLAAGEFMTEEYKSDETINVPPEILAKAEMIRPLTQEQQLIYDAVWTSFMEQ